jgi:hypothetical protein
MSCVHIHIEILVHAKSKPVKSTTPDFDKET